MARGKVKPYSVIDFIKIGKRQNQRATQQYPGLPLVNHYNATKHSFGLQKLDEGFGLDMIQAVMGHKDKRTTVKYAKYLTSS